MGSFSGLGIGLSFVFGCILMGLVAELYYLLWWKKKISLSSYNSNDDFSLLFCWKRHTPSFNSSNSSQELTNSVRNNNQELQDDLELGSAKDLGQKGYGEDGIETELMRAHNLCGPPRFLFTIKEESKEDLAESEDGKSRKGSRTKSLSDLVFAVDGGGTPFLTPLSSPTIRVSNFGDSYHSQLGFNNPLFESLSEAEVNRFRSSPPPKFKFLKDAEDKLIRRLLVEKTERKSGVKREVVAVQESGFREADYEKNGSSVKLITNQAKQVLPLDTSPTL